jgi:hypothetical protein
MGVGESSNFMQVPGFCLELSTNYWFFTSIGFLGIGAQAAANLYPSTGQNTSTSLLLFPVGLSMAWSTTTDKLVSGIVQIGAGPSLAVLLFEGAEPLTKIVPYINSSLPVVVQQPILTVIFPGMVLFLQLHEYIQLLRSWVALLP